MLARVLEKALANKPSFVVPDQRGETTFPTRRGPGGVPRAPAGIAALSMQAPGGDGEAYDRGLLEEALRLTQDSISALLRLQEHTTELHKRFVEGQGEGGSSVSRFCSIVRARCWRPESV